MGGTTEITNALDQIFQTQILEIFMSFIIAATVLLLLKIVAESLVGYIQFRLDKHIAIGSPVEVYGKKGRIKEISIFTITVESDCGYIRVPTRVWRGSKYLTLKDQMLLRNRRAGDE